MSSDAATTVTESAQPYDEALALECPHCGHIDFIRPIVTTTHVRGITRTTLAATTEHPCTPARIHTTRETR